MERDQRREWLEQAIARWEKRRGAGNISQGLETL